MIGRFLDWFFALFSGREKEIYEKQWVIETTATEILSIDWNGQVQRINLDDIRSFTVRTTDEGPLFCDVWYVVGYEDESISIPQGCTGEKDFLDYFFALNGFQYANFSAAMASTDNATFPCWELE